MAMGTLDMSTVRLVPGNLTMKQNVDMSVFLITDWRLKLKTVGRGLSMVVVMKRKITSEMMTTYFPTILLITITFATTFFKPFFFEAALSVNLTTMLRPLPTVLSFKLQSVMRKIDMSTFCFIVRLSGTKLTVDMSKVPITISMEHV